MELGCVRVSHYPAWVLLRHGGSRPLAVLSQGEIVAAGPTARARGVEKGMSPGRAHSLCEDLTLRSRDRSLEYAEWEEVEEKLNTTTPRVERATPGRSFLRPHDVEALRTVVGQLGAQAGLAPTRLDAHLAALKATTGNMLKIPSEHLDAFRRDLPVESLVALGVDPEMTERLDLFGYGTVAAVATLSRRHLEAQFGEKGAQLHSRLQGAEESSVSVYASPPTIEEAFRYEHPRSEPGPIETTITSLVEEAAAELEGRTAQRLTVELVSRREGRRVASRTLREATSSEDALCSTAHTLLRECLSTDVAIEEVRVLLGALAAPDARQASLFFDRPDVHRAIKNVHRKYPGALRRAVLNHDAVFSEEEIRYESASA